MNATALLPEGLREALGQVIANERREWRRERELIQAQAGETIANLRTMILQLETELRTATADRLASLKDGNDGSPGRDGIDGKDGAPGRDGVDGASARDGVDGKDGVPGENGKDGAPGERGQDGERGPLGLVGERGADGLVGAKGDPGVPGERGQDGERGLAGEKGDRGEVGQAGKDGAIGAQGERGEVGERGLEGAPGKLPVVKAWDDGVHYEGIVVSHAGSTYQALKDTGREPPHEDWHCIASAGMNGQDGKSLNVRGTWGEADTYSALDIVALNGASFIARQDKPGQCPGAGWQMIAAQGKRGNAGEPGNIGPKGATGLPGVPVVAAVLNKDGLLELTSGDGTVVTCDFYPLLAKVLR